MRNMVQGILVLAMLVTAGCLVFVGIFGFRAAAKRIFCLNRLRTLGGTLESYYEMKDCFPPGTVIEPALPPDERLSWFVLIWPYIEAGPSLRMNISEPWRSSANYPPYVNFFSKTNEPA